MIRPELIINIDPQDDWRLLHDLTPTFEAAYNHHMSITGDGKAGEWFPHEFIPYDIGRTFIPGELWKPEDLPIPEAVRSGLIVGVLTEDNLPWYSTVIDNATHGNEALREWNGRWTAEEWKHGDTLHALLAVSRLVDPVALERARMSQMSGGEVPHPVTTIDGIVYVTFQELATQVAHRNSAKLTSEYVLKSVDEKVSEEERARRVIIASAALRLMTQIGKDESRHHAFYRTAVDAALEINPNVTVQAIYRQLAEFEMPGTGIPDIKRHTARMAHAGIYNPRIHHGDIAQPLVNGRWKISEIEGLNDDGKRAQEALTILMDKLGSAATKFADRHSRPLT